MIHNFLLALFDVPAHGGSERRSPDGNDLRFPFLTDLVQSDASSWQRATSTDMTDSTIAATQRTTASFPGWSGYLHAPRLNLRFKSVNQVLLTVEFSTAAGLKKLDRASSSR